MTDPLLLNLMNRITRSIYDADRKGRRIRQWTLKNDTWYLVWKDGDIVRRSGMMRGTKEVMEAHCNARTLAEGKVYRVISA